VKACGFRLWSSVVSEVDMARFRRTVLPSSSLSEGVPPVLVTKPKNTPSQPTVLGDMCNL
jgi:hypothetical protein